MLADTILDILGLALKIFSGYFTVIALFAIFRPKKRQPCLPCHKFAIIVPARNEETVIGELVASLKKLDYPRELFTIFVVPNNCTDQTEAAASTAGARIINCTGKITCKGDALRQAVTQVMADQANYDVLCVFDADNVVDKRFLLEMNTAFCHGAKIAKGRNEAKNPYDSWIAGCYSIYFGMFNVLFNRARSVLGLSAKLVGTGFAVHRSVFAASGGWHTTTVTEDAEFNSQCAVAGHQVVWVPKAIAYDEEPNSFWLSMTQRRRWCSGIMQVSKLRLKTVLKSVPTGTPHLKLDCCMFLLAPFVQAISLLIIIAVLLLSLLNSPQMAVGYLTAFVSGLGISYLGVALMASAVVLLTRRRDVRMIKSILMYPIFMVSWLPLHMISLFKKTTTWKQIKHSRSLTLDEVAIDNTSLFNKVA